MKPVAVVVYRIALEKIKRGMFDHYPGSGDYQSDTWIMENMCEIATEALEYVRTDGRDRPEWLNEYFRKEIKKTQEASSEIPS